MKLFISPGNKKMGRIPSISLPPIITCPTDAPCRQRCKCYANKLCKLRPRFKNTLDRNLEYYSNKPGEYFDRITNYLSYANTRFNRWNVSGDLPTPDYFERLKFTAKKTSTINHLLFTKRFKFDKELFKRLPKNLSVVFSMWNNYGDESIKHPKAWYYDPKDPDPRIPATAIICPGNCETCNLCWRLKELKHDIILPKH